MELRLERLVATRGGLSRQLAARAIRDGRVTVSGEPVTSPATSVAESAPLCLDGAPLVDRARVIAWHKPAGVLTTLRDPWGRAGLESALPAGTLDRWHPVGRLDQDTSGLLLLSSEGAITQHLLHPRRAVEREYLATVDADPPRELGVWLAVGVDTADGTYPARVVRVQGRTVQLVVTEGKHRMVRRILANVGLPVLTLHRLRYGAVELGDLAEGAVRDVTAAELEAMGVG
jgi:23S rRNA pseudouridine2605 synthase